MSDQTARVQQELRRQREAQRHAAQAAAAAHRARLAAHYESQRATRTA